MTRVDFEARYRADPDPWDYETSAYEREKYAVTLAACGGGPHRHAMELGGSIGVFSALLAPCVGVLHTLDGAPTAVRDAVRRLTGHRNATAEVGRIPADLPAGPFDLVVASEVLYYLEEPDFERTLEVLHEIMAPGARLVAVHYALDGPERPLTAAQVHEVLRSCSWLRSIERRDAGTYLLDILKVPA